MGGLNVCSIKDPLSCPGQLVQSAVGDAIQNLASAVLEMFGTAMGSLGTVWVYIGTPNLTTGGGPSPIRAGSAAPSSGNLTTILGYAAWIGLAIAAVAMVWLGVLIAASLRRGEGALHVGRLGLVLAGAVLISAAGSLVAGLLPAGPRSARGATLFIQSGLWWYMSAVAVLSVIVAGVRMAWENRADPGKELLRSLLTLLIVAGASVTFVQLFITATDSLATWFLRGALKCDVAADSACFGKNVGTLLALGTNPATPGAGLGTMLTIVLGLVASLTAFAQIVLMVARSGMLVILAGVLPLSAAATNTEMGKNWFHRFLGWLIAFLLYKPAAAIVYATAFQLVGSNIFSSKDALVAILTGLMLMILALVALPALMRFVTPLVGSLAGGAGGAAMAAGAPAALPMGAAALGRLAAGGTSRGSGDGSSPAPTGSIRTSGGPGGAATAPGGSSGPNGNGGPSGPSGADGSGRSGAPNNSSANGPLNTSGNAAATGLDGTGQVPAPVGSGGSSTQAAAQAAERGAPASGGSAAVSLPSGPMGAAPGSAGGSAAAAGAAGPAGLAVGAVASGAGRAAEAARRAAASATEDSTGEGTVPDGSSR